MSTLRFTEIRKSFLGREVLRGLSAECLPGSITWVRGKNGCGKTTLFRIIAGLLRPDGGEVTLFEKPLNSAAPFRSHLALLPQIGVVLHEPMLLGALTIRENLKSLAPLFPAPRNVEELLTMLELSPFADVRVQECSQGTVRRAAFARALLGSPKVLILDEILSNLDGSGAEIVRAIISEEKARGVITVMSSHEELPPGFIDQEIVLR